MTPTHKNLKEKDNTSTKMKDKNKNKNKREKPKKEKKNWKERKKIENYKIMVFWGNTVKFSILTI